MRDSGSLLPINSEIEKIARESRKVTKAARVAAKKVGRIAHTTIFGQLD